MGTTKSKVPETCGGRDSMNLQLDHSAAPLFAAGFLATAMVFGGLSAGGSALGLGALRLLSEPAIELVASLVGGAVAASFLGRNKS